MFCYIVNITQSSVDGILAVYLFFPLAILSVTNLSNFNPNMNLQYIMLWNVVVLAYFSACP